MDGSRSIERERVRVQKGVKWERGMRGGTLREKVLGFVWTNWFLYKIGRAGYLKKIINYIIYFKYIGKGVQTNPPTSPPGPPNPMTGWWRVAAPRTQDRRVGWRIWTWKPEKDQTDRITPEKVLVFHWWERFANGFSSISQEMALFEIWLDLSISGPIWYRSDGFQQIPAEFCNFQPWLRTNQSQGRSDHPNQPLSSVDGRSRNGRPEVIGSVLS